MITKHFFKNISGFDSFANASGNLNCPQGCSRIIPPQFKINTIQSGVSSSLFKLNIRLNQRVYALNFDTMKKRYFPGKILIENTNLVGRQIDGGIEIPIAQSGGLVYFTINIPNNLINNFLTIIN